MTSVRNWRACTAWTSRRRWWSEVTDGILEELTEWQNRPLDRCYPLLYMDAMVVKVRTDGTVINRPGVSWWLASMWTAASMCWVCGWVTAVKAPRVWLSVLTEIRHRGLEDVLIVCCDGLKGLPGCDRGHLD